MPKLLSQAKTDYRRRVSEFHKCVKGVFIENSQTMSWASYQIRKILGCACTGTAGNIFPATDFKGNR